MLENDLRHALQEEVNRRQNMKMREKRYYIEACYAEQEKKLKIDYPNVRGKMWNSILRVKIIGLTKGITHHMLPIYLKEQAFKKAIN